MRLSELLDACAAVFATAIRRQLAYRVANWSGLFTNAFFLFFRAYALRACYAERASIGGLSATDIVTYVTVSQALLMVIPQWGRVEVADSVRSGQIAVDLCRPMDYFAGFLSKRLGVSAYYILFRFLPLMAVGWAAGLLSPPSAWETLPAFLATVVMGAWIANSLLFLVDVSAFWLGSERGLRYLFLGAGNLFSGLILPLSFLPEEMQKVSLALPFEYTLYLPVEVYLGSLSGDALASAMTIQLAWVVGLTILCRAILSAGVRKLVIHGG